ncbi:hypothetical protein PAPYR_9764 [Paratrimastix pyriformis]|uniref:Uncharacterized protein n=1 Tax=Paratrimastix pyriformis TaxID=342808 RepID=A0ABQ8UD75_9EUKA|nr:hypothetical protein PAPYR_9764 [Paratrimastix pyriformis]
MQSDVFSVIASGAGTGSRKLGAPPCPRVDRPSAGRPELIGAEMKMLRQKTECFIATCDLQAVGGRQPCHLRCALLPGVCRDRGQARVRQVQIRVQQLAQQSRALVERFVVDARRIDRAARQASRLRRSLEASMPALQFQAIPMPTSSLYSISNAYRAGMYVMLPPGPLLISDRPRCCLSCWAAGRGRGLSGTPVTAGALQVADGVPLGASALIPSTGGPGAPLGGRTVVSVVSLEERLANIERLAQAGLADRPAIRESLANMRTLARNIKQKEIEITTIHTLYDRAVATHNEARRCPGAGPPFHSTAPPPQPPSSSPSSAPPSPAPRSLLLHGSAARYVQGLAQAQQAMTSALLVRPARQGHCPAHQLPAKATPWRQSASHERPAPSRGQGQPAPQTEGSARCGHQQMGRCPLRLCLGLALLVPTCLLVAPLPICLLHRPVITYDSTAPFLVARAISPVARLAGLSPFRSTGAAAFPEDATPSTETAFAILAGSPPSPPAGPAASSSGSLMAHALAAAQRRHRARLASLLPSEVPTGPGVIIGRSMSRAPRSPGHSSPDHSHSTSPTPRSSTGPQGGGTPAPSAGPSARLGTATTAPGATALPSGSASTGAPSPGPPAIATPPPDSAPPPGGSAGTALLGSISPGPSPRLPPWAADADDQPHPAQAASPSPQPQQRARGGGAGRPSHSAEDPMRTSQSAPSGQSPLLQAASRLRPFHTFVDSGPAEASGTRKIHTSAPYESAPTGHAPSGHGPLFPTTSRRPPLLHGATTTTTAATSLGRRSPLLPPSPAATSGAFASATSPGGWAAMGHAKILLVPPARPQVVTPLGAATPSRPSGMGAGGGLVRGSLGTPPVGGPRSPLQGLMDEARDYFKGSPSELIQRHRRVGGLGLAELPPAVPPGGGVAAAASEGTGPTSTAGGLTIRAGGPNGPNGPGGGGVPILAEVLRGSQQGPAPGPRLVASNVPIRRPSTEREREQAASASRVVSDLPGTPGQPQQQALPSLSPGDILFAEGIKMPVVGRPTPPASPEGKARQSSEPPR